jgi:hypothetical protein
MNLKRLSEEEIDIIKSRLIGVSPAPWEVVKESYVGQAGFWEEYIGISGVASDIYDSLDAEFIAASRSDIPKLIETIDALEIAHERSLNYMSDTNAELRHDIEKLESCLREIDVHIRSTNDPIPYIIKSIKNILKEYE